MNKPVAKHSKKEEQKKLMVRIVCIALVVALVATSILTMFPTLFANDNDQTYSLEEMVEAGIIYLGEDGNYYFNEEYLTVEAEAADEGLDQE